MQFTNSKKNLAQQREEEETRTQLIAQRDATRAAIAEAQANIAKLQLEMATLKSDVESEETKQSNITKAIREREVRNTMMESYDRSQQVASNIMREYQARLLQVISHLKNQNLHTPNHSTPPTAVFGQKPHSTRDPSSIYSSNKPVLETNSTRLIREVCELVKDAHDKRMSSQEIDAFVKGKLKDIFGMHEVRSNEILETLTHLALTLVKLCESRRQIPKKAIGAAKNSKRKGVAELLFDLRAAHSARFFHTIALRDACRASPSAAPAPEHLPANATQLRRMQGTLRGMRAALRVLNERIAEMQADAERGVQSGANERVDQARAQLNRLLRTRNEQAIEIMRLRAENIDYMAKINHAREVMGEIVRANISPTKLELSSAREAFIVNTKMEIETLNKMDVSKSLPATLGRNKDAREEGIMTAIKSNSDSGPETLLQKLFAAKIQLEEAVQRVEYERRLLEASMRGNISTSINNSRTISTIVAKNEEFMEVQRQLAVRQQALRKETEQAINKASITRQKADVWWQQPAQYLVPWVSNVNGRPLEEFLHEWRSLCAMLEIK